MGAALAGTAYSAQNTLSLDANWPPTLQQYLPEGQAYDETFPRPESVLGWPVGTWHVRHDQLVNWFETCAESSPRFSLESYGRTHESRPLLLATVTSPANHARIDEIREAHVKAVLEGAESYDGPAVVWMGYGVHGNESSASNASMLLAYHLSAATGPEIDAFLENTIVLIDPCVNPDGGARFAHWANMHRGKNLSLESSHRDHSEAWPGGRTNHYWFDLNRDWLLLTHPESRGRVRQFHRWMPTVLTDYHEMGSGSSYFFQPGIPSRRNPLTPESNHALTAEISTYHARALDKMGSQYFTEERFDDFYYGKGSTYPDIHGAIGILFEQASSRGHAIRTDRGELSFPFTILNQFTTSLTTLEAVDAMRDRLGAHQRGFYREALAEASKNEAAGWVFGDERDPARAATMADLLRRHGIEVDRLTDGRYRVAAAQPQYRLIRALFETRTSWDDNTFYDVSSWAFPLSFDLPLEAVSQANWASLPEPLAVEELGNTDLYTGPEVIAYAFEWHSSHAAKHLHTLQKHGIRARIATDAFEGRMGSGTYEFAPGTIVVQFAGQDAEKAKIVDALRSIANDEAMQVSALTSGLTPAGSDLGSGSFSLAKKPNLAIVIGGRVSAYEAGEVWHDLDTRVGMAVTLLERADGISASALEPFTHLVMVNGASSRWDDGDRSAVQAWVRAGGTLIATKGSAVWAANSFLGKAAAKAEHSHEGHGKDEGDKDAKAPERPSYGDYEKLRAEQRVAGTIFQARLDRTHPLGFGFTRDELPVFRNFESVLPEGRDPFAVPLRYADEPLLSGFANDKNVRKFAGSPAIRAERVGSGVVIALIDNPVFRGVWYGSRRLLLNAVFMSGAIRGTGPIAERSAAEEADYDHGHAHNR